MQPTNEGGVQFEHSLDHALEFFSKAGSLFTGKQSFYGNEESALSLFQKVWIVDEELAFKLLLWLRDCRGGAGNRSGFRACLNWLATLNEQSAKWIIANIDWIPEVGRWDDLRALFNTPIEVPAAQLWAKAILENNVLAAKWADRKDKPIKHAIGIIEEGRFRKLLSYIRKNHIVEHKMSTKRFNEIEYHTVPSLAMARYTNAFKRNDPERFQQYKDDLKSGKSSVHADALFPHDCIRTLRSGDHEIANAQFDALPNYMGSEKAIVIADTSGSMDIKVSGSIKAVDVSQGLALYCSAKIPEDNPFHKKFIGFCNEGKFVNWEDYTFSEAASNSSIFDGAIGSTRIDKALDLILDTAKFFKFSQEQMPDMLIVVSDMQFHQGTDTRQNWTRREKIDPNYKAETEINKALGRWKERGYTPPKIVYWNVAGYAGSPDTKEGKNIALVSGFSPAILKAIFDGEDFTPLAIMYRTLEKYKVERP